MSHGCLLSQFAYTTQTNSPDGILQTISLETKTKQEDVQDAFKDLEALMVRAGEMVRLVKDLNTKLDQSQRQKSALSHGSTASATPSTAGEDEATRTFLQSSFVQLGLPAPALTQDMVADEKKYVQGLAAELGRLLTTSHGEGLMVGKNGRGVVGLDQAWGLWNRARGVCESVRVHQCFHVNVSSHICPCQRSSPRPISSRRLRSCLNTPVLESKP